MSKYDNLQMYLNLNEKLNKVRDALAVLLSSMTAIHKNNNNNYKEIIKTENQIADSLLYLTEEIEKLKERLSNEN